MNHLFTFQIFEKKSKWLEGYEVKPGMKGADYGDEEGVVKVIYSVKNLNQIKYDILRRYDGSGWTPRKLDDFIKDTPNDGMRPLDDEDWVVGVESDEDTAVYIYGGEGFLVPATERWKGSKKLSKTNKKIGMFENWRSSDKIKSVDDLTGIMSASDNVEEIATQMLKDYSNNNEIKAIREGLEAMCKLENFEGYDDFCYHYYGEKDVKQVDQKIIECETNLYKLIETFVKNYTSNPTAVTEISSTLLDGGPHANVVREIERSLKRS